MHLNPIHIPETSRSRHLNLPAFYYLVVLPSTTFMTMSGSIADLPPELLLDIFALACTDTGRTGCSLRAVSWYFRTICIHSGVDLNTVALCGARRMAAFKALLEGRKQECRRVRNLFLTDREMGDRRLQPSGCSAIELSADILRSVSTRDLRILTVDLPSWRVAGSTTPSIFHHSFPSLTDLTLCCGLDVPFFNGHHSYPNLRRLDIASHRQLPNTLGMSISGMAPQLTHLRLSGIDSPAKSGDLHDVLRVYTSIPQPTIPNVTRPSITDHTLPHSVNTLIIGFDTCFQLVHPALSSRRQMNYLQNAQTIRQLAEEYHVRTTKETTLTHGEGRFTQCNSCPIKPVERKLVVHPTPPMRPFDDVEMLEVSKINYARLRADWDDRVQGGAAGWDA